MCNYSSFQLFTSYTYCASIWTRTYWQNIDFKIRKYHGKNFYERRIYESDDRSLSKLSYISKIDGEQSSEDKDKF